MRLTGNLTLLIAGLVFTASALADATSDARKAIQASYDSDNAAAKRRDVNGFLAHTSSDYVGTDAAGAQHTLADSKKFIATLFKNMKELSAVSKIKSITLKGASAKIMVDEVVKLKMAHPQTGAIVLLEIDETNADTWVKTAKGWMKKSSKTLKEKRLQDGTPLN